MYKFSDREEEKDQNWTDVTAGNTSIMDKGSVRSSYFLSFVPQGIFYKELLLQILLIFYVCILCSQFLITGTYFLLKLFSLCVNVMCWMK